MNKKEEVIADASKFQRVCASYVRRNVIHCVSALIYELRGVADELDDYDTYVALTAGKPDYEEAAYQFVMNDADLDDLEAIVEENGYWSDVLAEVGAPDGADAEEWLEAHPEAEKALRRAAWKMTDEASDGPEWVCNHFDLEPEYGEIYEHWIVDRYFGKQLIAAGEIVEDYLGLTVWGRTTTGQAIYMDGVIEQIVQGLDGDHWVWKEV